MTQRPTTTATGAARIRWRCCRFVQLRLRELQAIHIARQQVFVREQNCVFVDADGHDEAALHIAAWSPAHALPLAYARVLPPGCTYAEASIGRVLSTAAGRGTGLGREAVRRAIETATRHWPGQGLRISAQEYLRGFYTRAGFEAVGPIYLEDGIEHVEMFRPATGQAITGSSSGRC